jgi:hypothetical protein
MALNLSRLDLATLYDRDIALWSEAMVDLLQQGQFDQLDLKHLIDEVEDLGRRQRDRLGQLHSANFAAFAQVAISTRATFTELV